MERIISFQLDLWFFSKEKNHYVSVTVADREVLLPLEMNKQEPYERGPWVHSREPDCPPSLCLWPLWGLFGCRMKLCWVLFVSIETFYRLIVLTPSSLFLPLMMS